MNELIKITSRDGIETVSARELYDFLGNDKTQWSRWSSKNIVGDYFFQENIDYISLDIMSNHQKSKDYYISVDMAKELSMLSRNSKGKEARQYFILMEKKARMISAPELTEAEIVQKALIIQQKKIEQLSIKAMVADELADTDGLYLPSIAGKIIMGDPNIFCQWLVDNKIMFRQKAKLVPYSQFDKKYFEIKVSKYGNKSTIQSYFTTRGVCWIQAKYLKSNNLLQLDYSENIK